MAKKLLLIGFIVSFVAISAAIFFLMNNQEKRATTTQTSILSVLINTTQQTAASTPFQAKVNDTIEATIELDPKTNFVNAIRLQINYDPQKVSLVDPKFQKNAASFPEGSEPVYENGKIIITLGTGPNPLSAIKTKTTVGKITFKAIALTTDTPTLISIPSSNNETTLRSNNEASDQAAENVLASTLPAYIAISGSGIANVTPAVSPSVTITPTGSQTGGHGATVTQAPNQRPTCSSLTTDKSSAGSAPLDLTFIATGNDPDGTIRKVTFNFGDGVVENVTTGQGIGSQSATLQLAHTYRSAGSFTTSAVFTDNKDETSSTAACTQSIIVAAPTALPTKAPPIVERNPVPSIEPPGPGETVLGIGAIGAIVTIIGTLLFFTL